MARKDTPPTTAVTTSPPSHRVSRAQGTLAFSTSEQSWEVGGGSGPAPCSQRFLLALLDTTLSGSRDQPVAQIRVATETIRVLGHPQPPSPSSPCTLGCSSGQPPGCSEVVPPPKAQHSRRMLSDVWGGSRRVLKPIAWTGGRKGRNPSPRRHTPSPHFYRLSHLLMSLSPTLYPDPPKSVSRTSQGPRAGHSPGRLGLGEPGCCSWVLAWLWSPAARPRMAVAGSAQCPLFS